MSPLPVAAQYQSYWEQKHRCWITTYGLFVDCYKLFVYDGRVVR